MKYDAIPGWPARVLAAVWLAAGAVVGGPAAADSVARCEALHDVVEYSPPNLSSQSGASANALAAEGRQQNWRLLFDGASLQGWTGLQESAVPPAWAAEKGALTLPKFEGEMPDENRGDIRTAEAFDEFELRFQWAIAPGGNSGIFYFVRDAGNRIWEVAPEMQLLDDSRHEDGREPSHRTGALYDIYPPRCDATKPAGEYNDSRLVVRNRRVEHWLNGYRVVDYDPASVEFRSRVARSKFRSMDGFANTHSGHIALQDHGDEVRFRNIRIRELPKRSKQRGL